MHFNILIMYYLTQHPLQYVLSFSANNSVTEGLLCGNTNTGFDVENKSMCCEWNSTVSIRHCTDENNAVFYAYQVPVLPFCDMSFCAGNIQPCIAGYAWNYDIKQCQGKYFCTLL